MASALRPRKTRRLDTDDDPPSGPSRPRKRTKRSVHAAGTNLLGMPLDMIYEILAYLEPTDLLALARTCKDLRANMMHRSSAHVWRAARLNVEDLPPCPEDMSEPAYANLLFRTDCHRCSQPATEIVEWDCRARYCSRCDKAIRQWYRDPADLGTVFGKTAIEFPLSAVPIIHLCPTMDPSFKPKWENIWRETDLRVILRRQDVQRLWKHIAGKKPQEMYAIIQREGERMKRKREQMAKVKTWHERWIAKLKSEKEQSRVNAKEARCDSIWNKCVGLGYETELNAIGKRDFALHALVKQPKPLTDRIWKNMEPKVVEWMEDVRYNRLKKERGPRIYRRLRVLSVAVAAILPRRRGEPSLCDIALGIPELKPILEEPSQEGVTVADFDFLKTALPAFAVKWREDVQAHLRSVAMEKIKAAGVELAPSVDPLSSAIGSVFICTSCTDSHVIRRDYLTEFTYPDLLSHVCIRQALPYTGNYFADAVAEHLRHLPHWEPAKFQSIGVDMMKGLLEKCGLEPKTATLADLDALRFRCLKHHDDWTLRVRNWQSLFHHWRPGKYQTEESKCDTSCYMVVPEDQCAAAKLLEESAMAERAKERETSRWWICVHCSEMQPAHMTKNDVVKHLTERHGIAAPAEEDMQHGAAEERLELWSTSHVELKE